MNHLFDWIAAWMHREQAAVAYLIVCLVLIIQTYVIFGR